VDIFNISYYLLHKMKANKHYEDELLSPYTPYTSQISFKKDFFIQSRTEDIKQFY
jgi:hypothetical protein